MSSQVYGNASLADLLRNSQKDHMPYHVKLASLAYLLVICICTCGNSQLGSYSWVRAFTGHLCQDALSFIYFIKQHLRLSQRAEAHCDAVPGPPGRVPQSRMSAPPGGRRTQACHAPPAQSGSDAAPPRCWQLQHNTQLCSVMHRPQQSNIYYVTVSGWLMIVQIQVHQMIWKLAS